MRFTCTCFAIGLLMTLAIPSMAAYSGLTFIPTADTVGANQYSLLIYSDGSFRDPNADSRYFCTEIGIGDRFEAGVDFDISKGADKNASFNAKYALPVDRNKSLHLACGIYGTEVHTKSVPYIVATKVLKYGRLHLGDCVIEGKNRWFVGADKALGNKWTVLADYTNGDENYSSLSFNYQLSDNFGIMAGAEFPNTTGDTLFIVAFSLNGSIKRCPPCESAKQ